MQKVYHVRTDDGKRFDFPADSAAHAIGKALAENLGHRVTECWVGQPQTDPKWKSTEAFVTFEIPPHEPLQAKQRSKKKDLTQPLFDDEVILAASKLAKDNTERRSL